MEGEIPRSWHLQPWKSLVRQCSSAIPFPPRAGIPRPRPGVTWMYKVGETQAHTHSDQHTHSCSGKPQPGDYQREGFYLRLDWEEEASHRKP